MPTCLECFCESGLEGRDLLKHVDKFHPDFVCENDSCSPYSPGPVDDGETLAFILIHPLHYDDHRDVVMPSAFQELTKRDLSTLRVGIATRDETERIREQLVQRGLEKIPPQMRLVNEICKAKVVEIRSCLDGDRRTMAVYDTSLEKVPSHASVFTRYEFSENRQLRKRIRSQVYEVFAKQTNRMTYSDFIESLDG